MRGCRAGTLAVSVQAERAKAEAKADIPNPVF